MNKRYIATLLLVFLGFAVAYGQVTGSVKDSTGNAVPFCTVMMIKASDSSAVTGTTASESGAFSLEKKENGEFRVLVIFSGYENYYSAPFTLTDAQTAQDVGVLTLKASANLMNEVQITAQKPFMEQKLDRTVFNIENSILATGNTALDVLRKLPGVNVDNNDNISVRGKQGVMFMIDGRRSYMAGAEMANYLRGIDASQLERIEVITNPSAKYDAAGSAIINIVLKRNRNLGYNQQLTAASEQGFYGGASISTNLNYKTEKWNFFGSGSVGQWQFYEEYQRKVIYDPDSSNSTSSVGTGRRHIDGMYNYVQGGIEYSPGKRHTIGFVAERSGGKRHQERRFDAVSYDQGQAMDSSLFSRGPEDNSHTYYSGGLNYKFDIDTTGRTLTADFNYADFSTRMHREVETSFFGSDWSVIHAPSTQISYFRLSVAIAAGQIDYVHPLKNENGLFEAGIRGSHVTTSSAANYYRHQGGIWVWYQDVATEFVYTEIIPAGYVNYSRKLSKKIEMQIGVRAEQTISKGEDRLGTELFNRQYLRIFPSTFLNWNVDSSNAINFSYSRRIDRPDYGELNPLVFYSDPYTTNTGNPYLQPQMSHYVEVAHVFKGTYRTAISYMNMTSVIYGRVTVDNSTNVVNTQAENLATYNVATLEFSAQHSVTNWYTLSGSFYVFRDHYFGPVNGTDYSVVNWTGLFFVQNRISLKNEWGLEANFFYRSVNVNGIWRDQPFSGLDIGARKRFGHGKGSVALTFTDVFQNTYLNSTADYGNVFVANSGRNDSRRVRLSVSWKLGRSEYEREQRRNSADELKGRAQ